MEQVQPKVARENSERKATCYDVLTFSGTEYSNLSEIVYNAC